VNVGTYATEREDGKLLEKAEGDALTTEREREREKKKKISYHAQCTPINKSNGRFALLTAITQRAQR
jgi:hypothetical protein